MLTIDDKIFIVDNLYNSIDKDCYKIFIVDNLYNSIHKECYRIFIVDNLYNSIHKDCYKKHLTFINHNFSMHQSKLSSTIKWPIIYCWINGNIPISKGVI